MSSSGDLFKLVGRILIENSEAIEAINNTTQEAKDLGEKLKDAGNEADNASDKMGSTSKINTAAVWLGNVLYDLTTKAAALTFNLGKIGIGFNAGIESYEYQFRALLNDEDKARQLVADIQELAKVSPLGLEGLASNAVTLLTTGTELAEVVPTLEMLGNLALGDPQHMDAVVRAFTQIIGKGGLMAQEMYQLGDAMVPIVEIMTKYGGEKYADGSWYQQKMNDPTFKIPAEDMIRAFHAATAEGGKWHDFMYTYMESFAGQWDRLGEQGKETLGMVTKPLFDVLKSEVLPKLTESLEKFATWASENQDTLRSMADALGNFAKVSFDAVLSAFQWITENGEAIALAITAIATAMAFAAGSAHPYAYAVTAIVSALALMKSANADGDPFDGFLRKYSDEELAKLQAWIDAANETRAAGEALNEAWSKGEDTTALTALYTDAQQRQNALFEEANAIDGLMAAYYAWNSGQEGNAGQNLYLDVIPKVSEDGETIVQGELDGMELEATAEIKPDMKAVYAQNGTRLTMYADVVPGMSKTPLKTFDGGRVSEPATMHKHATGAWRVPYDGYLARLHQDEMVLRSTDANAVRSGSFGDTGRLESLMSQMMTLMQQVAQNTSGGKQVVLDSGVLVGQLAPALDARLGTISMRKGRRG